MSDAARLSRLRESIAALRVMASERSAVLLPLDVMRDTSSDQRLAILNADPRFMALVDAENALDNEARELADNIAALESVRAAVARRQAGPFALHVISKVPA